MKWFISISAVLVLSLMSIVPSRKQESKTKPAHITIIKGKIEFSPGNSIDLYAYPDEFQKYLNKKIIIASVPVGKTGEFSFLLNFYQPSAFDLKIGNRILVSNLFLCPNDEITINFDGAELNPRITLNAKGGKSNQFLLIFDEKFFKTPRIKRDYYINSNFLRADEYSEYLKARRIQELRSYDEYFSDAPPRKEFATYVLSEINYQYAVDKLMYLWKKGIKNKQVDVSNDYYDFVSKDFIENPAALNSPSYVHFLNLYFIKLYEEQQIRIQQAGNRNGMHESLEKITVAEQNFSGLSRQIITLNILKDEANSFVN